MSSLVSKYFQCQRAKIILICEAKNLTFEILAFAQRLLIYGLLSMNYKFSKIALSVLLAGMLFTACRNPDKFSDTPHLEWRKAEYAEGEGNTREILLTTYFTDGDGNIGRDKATDPCEASSYDLLIQYFEKVNGAYKEIFPKATTPPDCLLFHNVLPNITPEGQNKVLEGEITVVFSYIGYPENNNVDSVKFALQMVDRAGNKSGIVESPSIFIPE